MRFLMRKYRAVRWRDRRDAQRVCRRARDHGERAHFAPEVFAEHTVERLGPLIVAIGLHAPMIDTGERLHDLRAARRRVVAIKPHRSTPRANGTTTLRRQE